jgi:WhiB family transcriptional regulator, redox-sensing transcriptional regulator
MTWQTRAACVDEDPALFFPIGNTGADRDQIAEAKAVCDRCEVVETCLTWAIESHQDAGVWGGLTADERLDLKRRTPRVRRVA